MEWDTLPRASQHPRTAHIPSVSGRLTIYQMAMVFDTPRKPQARFPQVPHSSWQDLLDGVLSYLRLQRCPLLHAASSELWPIAANTARVHALLNSHTAFTAPKGASSLRDPWYTPPSKQAQRMRKRQSAETNMPSLAKHSNTISVPAQQFLVPSMLRSAPPSPLSRRLPAHDCSADLVVEIGPVVGIHHAPPIH